MDIRRKEAFLDRWKRYFGSAELPAVPMNKFAAMIDNMDESFLITKSWGAVRRRMG